MEKGMASLTAPIEVIQQLSGEALEAKLDDARFAGKVEARAEVAAWLREVARTFGHPKSFNPQRFIEVLAQTVENFGDVPQEND